MPQLSQRTHSTVKPAVPAQVALRVSPYEQVSSGLMAMLVLTGAVVLLLFLVWIGSKVTFTQAAVPVVPIIVDNETGGYEHGVLNESIELPGPVTGELGFGGAAPEPSFLETMQMVTSVVAARQAQLVDPNLSDETKWSTGGIGGSRGTGNAPALGLGGGSGGGVARSQRWVIDYQEGGSLQIYAQQLDFFKVELAAIGGTDQIEYASNLSKNKPDKRTGPADKEERLYFSWRQGSLQQADKDLLAKAGISHANRLVVQFYPKETEDLLAYVEDVYLKSKFPGRSIKTVRQTRFKVQPDKKGYTFVVTNQTYLGG